MNVIIKMKPPCNTDLGLEVMKIQNTAPKPSIFKDKVFILEMIQH